MTEEEYKAAIEQYKAEHYADGSLEHGEWKKHKYIRIENGRYIYPEDDKKISSSPAARNRTVYGDHAQGGGSPKGHEQNHSNALNLAKAGGDRNVTDKKLEEVSDKARVEAAKEYANDLTDALVETGTYWLKGFDANLDPWDYLNKLIEKKGIRLTNEGMDEVRNMAMKQMIPRIDDEITRNEKVYDSTRVKEWREERGEFLNTIKGNRPYKDRKSEIDDFEDKQKAFNGKIRHSDHRADFYAAVYDYKQAHKR